jgi:ABC-type sugar transport system substrate-binding protein
MRPRRIALIAKNRNNPAYEGARIGAVRVAADHGATIEFDAPETADDIDEQRALIEAALDNSPDGFVVIPAHVIGVNATPDGIAEIKAGRLLASAAFDAQKMACLAVEAVLRLIDGQPVPRRIDLPVEIVDASNYGPWDLPYDERRLPVWAEIVG